MSTAWLVQACIVAIVVVAAALSAARRLLPVTSRRIQANIVGAVDRPAAPAWLRALARRATPRASSGGSCGDGCSSCGGCGTAADSPVVKEQPLVFRPRSRN